MWATTLLLGPCPNLACKRPRIMLHADRFAARHVLGKTPQWAARVQGVAAMHRARPPLLPRALPLCRAPACSTALPHAVPARDPLYARFLSLLLAPLRTRAASAMAGPAELPCCRCSLSYNPPAPAQSSPSEARGTVRPPSPLHRLFRPSERRRHLFRRARATGHRGQAATSHLRPCRGLLRARA